MMADSLLLLEAFDTIEIALNQLCLHMHDALRQFPVWVHNGAEGLEANRDKVIYVLKHFQPTPGLSPQETFACVGAVGGTLETLQLVERVNQAKTQFKQQVDQYLKDSLEQDTAIIREMLAHHGYPAMKLKQVYRHIRTIPYHPRRLPLAKAGITRIKSLPSVKQNNCYKKQGRGCILRFNRLSLAY